MIMIDNDYMGAYDMRFIDSVGSIYHHDDHDDSVGGSQVMGNPSIPSHGHSSLCIYMHIIIIS